VASLAPSVLRSLFVPPLYREPRFQIRLVMRILLIGGNGFIGTPLSRELMDAGHDLAVFHRNRDGCQPGVKHLRGDRNRLIEYLGEFREFSPDVIVDMVLSSGEQARQLMMVAGELNARVVAIGHRV
jgi:hypothetical protein